jgi:hypothetical protein
MLFLKGNKAAMSRSRPCDFVDSDIQEKYKGGMKKSIVAFLTLFVCSIIFSKISYASADPLGNQTRYTFGELRDEIYLFDTQTGKVWRLNKGSPDTLNPVEFLCDGNRKGFDTNCGKLELPTPPKELAK